MVYAVWYFIDCTVSRPWRLLFESYYLSYFRYTKGNHSHYFGFECSACPNPLPDNKILDWSKLKQIADDILMCIQNEK